MKRRNALLAIALGLSAFWLAAGAPWLTRESESVISEHLRAREDICERPGLTDADRSTCQSQLRSDTDRLQSFQSDLQGDSLRVALLILLAIWSGAACIGLFASAVRGQSDAEPQTGPHPHI